MCSLVQAWIFLILSNLLAAVSGQTFCGYPRRNYTSGGIYESNYYSLLTSLYTKVDETGFYKTYVGENPDRVYGFILCLGDVQIDYCQNDCISNGRINFAQRCPLYAEAMMWNDACILVYSDQPSYGTSANVPGIYEWASQNVSSPDQFGTDLGILLKDLFTRAANGTSVRKVAAGSRHTADNQTIYAMVQCTPDLTSQDCSDCLTIAVQQMQKCCSGSPLVKILLPSCYIHYDAKMFYNNSRLLELAQIPVSPPPVPGRSAAQPSRRTLTVITVSVSAGVILLIVTVILLRKRIKKKTRKELETIDISNVESLQYDFETIRTATNDFAEANKLGQGGFGSVYKGQLLDGQEIAVKRLSVNSYQGDLEFKNEVVLLAKLQHRNLVRLFGFALQGIERLLVYEYLQNSSLEHFIFDRSNQGRLDWDTCYMIIRGISRGIQYLHEDSRLQIIHRDLKPSNVLLDAKMTPKIADFGTARLLVPQDESVTHTSTVRIVGTYGYMSPEYAIHGHISVKSDVFSFGVLVLEIVTGWKNSSPGTYGKAGNLLISTVWKNWNGGTPEEVINPALISNSTSIPQNILRCIQIGLLCVQENPTARPTMASVVLMLSGDTITMPVPSAPGFYLPDEYVLELLDSVDIDATPGNTQPSANGMTITELNPR